MTDILGAITKGSVPPSDFVALDAQANVVSVPSQVASLQLLPANARRREMGGSPNVIIVNNSTAIMYVLLGAGAAGPGNFTYELPAITNGVPATKELDFNGPIQGAWAAANGSAEVTEIVG